VRLDVEVVSVRLNEDDGNVEVNEEPYFNDMGERLDMARR